MRLRATLASAAFSALLTISSAAFAQGDKAPMRMLVGVQAGATTDTIARMLADKLRDILGEPIVVENKPGAAQRIALGELKKAPPDGRTMMLSGSSAFSIIPHIYGDQTGYDPVKDFIPVTRVVAFQVGLAAGPKTGAKNFAEFLTWAKAHPTEVSYGSPGAGSSSHFVGIMLSKAIKVPMTHVPYRGGAPALTDLMGGHIALVTTAFSDLPNLHREGKLRIIGNAGYTRSTAVPDVPTLREQGIDIAFDVGFDIHVPANVPPETVKRLNAAIVQVLNMADVRAKLEGMGVQPAPMTPEAFLARQNEEIKLWAEPVKESGFKGE